jgi:hypothetical protein
MVDINNLTPFTVLREIKKQLDTLELVQGKLLQKIENSMVNSSRMSANDIAAIKALQENAKVQLVEYNKLLERIDTREEQQFQIYLRALDYAMQRSFLQLREKHPEIAQYTDEFVEGLISEDEEVIIE